MSDFEKGYETGVTDVLEVMRGIHADGALIRGLALLVECKRLDKKAAARLAKCTPRAIAKAAKELREPKVEIRTEGGNQAPKVDTLN